MDTKPCNWPIDYAECGDATEVYDRWGEGAEDPAAATQAARNRFESVATELLWRMTNEVFGLCSVELRPCRSDCAPRESTFWGRGPYPAPGLPASGSPWTPVLIRGEWYNIACGSCLGTCSCGLDGARALSLPGPVSSIDEVLIDGEALAESAYRLDYSRVLIRQDGATWPACQDLLAAPDADGAFTIRYQRGIAVPIGGQVAAGTLAVELAKGACDDGSCRLPQRLQTITRQGMTVGFADKFTELKEGRVGIWSIDAWIASVTRPAPRSSVRSPDVPRRKVGGQPWRI